MALDTYYFTFSKNYLHPETKKPLSDYWIEIAATSLNKAERKMRELFGDEWRAHSELQFMRYYMPCNKGCYARYEID
jgi:hypothetical protein